MRQLGWTLALLAMFCLPMGCAPKPGEDGSGVPSESGHTHDDDGHTHGPDGHAHEDGDTPKEKPKDDPGIKPKLDPGGTPPDPFKKVDDN